MKRTVILLTVLAVAVTAYLGLSYRSDVEALFAPPIIVDLRPNDHMEGAPGAPVTIVEYASFTCHFCAAFQRDVVPALTRDYIASGKVKLVFREFPFDPAARAASALARCFSGDAYFAFADQLFLKQEEWLSDLDGDQQVSMMDVVEGLIGQARLTGMGASRPMPACAIPAISRRSMPARWRGPTATKCRGRRPSSLGANAMSVRSNMTACAS
jgi:hypothetical protein